jgi:hypothetical protein
MTPPLLENKYQIQVKLTPEEAKTKDGGFADDANRLQSCTLSDSGSDTEVIINKYLY